MRNLTIAYLYINAIAIIVTISIILSLKIVLNTSNSISITTSILTDSEKILNKIKWNSQIEWHSFTFTYSLILQTMAIVMSSWVCDALVGRLNWKVLEPKTLNLT